MLEQALKKWYEDSSYPPDPEYLGENVEQVSHETLDSLRWGNLIQVVYTDGTEHWAVRDVEPATENQSWGDYGDPDIFQVEPYEKTVIKYRKVTS